MDHKLIEVTHFVNPHMFYFRYEQSRLEPDAVEKLLQKFCSTLKSAPDYFPTEGEIVAVYHLEWRKWIRACVEQVVHLTTDVKFIIWALDFGLPMLTKPKYIRKLSEKYGKLESNIKFGGIADIVPAQKVFENATCSVCLMKYNNWSTLAVENVNNLIKDAAAVHFIMKTRLPSGQILGDLEVTTYRSNKPIQVSSLLKGIDQAVNDAAYVTIIKKIGTNSLKRWTSNNGEPFAELSSLKTMCPKSYSITLQNWDKQSNCSDAIKKCIEEKISDWDYRNQRFQTKNLSASGTEKYKTLSITGDALDVGPATSINEKQINSDLLENQSDCSNSRNASSEVIEEITDNSNNNYFNARKKLLARLNSKARQCLNSKPSSFVISDIIKQDLCEVDNLNRSQSDKEFEKLENSNVSLSSDISYRGNSSVSQRISKPGKATFDNVDEIRLQSNLTKDLVLVHGKHVARPIDKLARANFHEEVHRELSNSGFSSIFRMQAYTWPHLMRGNSAVIINAPDTGKTMSYLPAICSIVKEKQSDNSVPDGVGPIAVIIAPNSCEVIKIERACRRYFDSSPSKLNIVKSCGFKDLKKTLPLLLKGCDILIVTPPSLMRLQNNDERLFDSSRVQHIVIDNVDFMFNLDYDAASILKLFLQNFKMKTIVQTVVVSCVWNSCVGQLLRASKNPQLCIGSHIEAAVYMKIKFKLEITGSASKTALIIDFIRDRYKYERSVIICSKDEEVDAVWEVLVQAGIPCILFKSNSDPNQLDLAATWHDLKANEMLILICTDAVLPDLKIRNAQNMISYSLPGSWSRCSFRFAMFLDYYEDILKNENHKSNAVGLIILDEENNIQLPKLIDFLLLHKCCEVPQQLVELAKKIRSSEEEQRAAIRTKFCPLKLEYGKCFKQNVCKNRHAFNKLDVSKPYIPLEGPIIVQILEVFSPTHYCARLLQHTNNNESAAENNGNDYLNFNFEFAEYFSESANHQTHWPVSLNDLCVIADQIDNSSPLYCRCKVLQIGPQIGIGTDYKVDLMLIDNGRHISAKTSGLLVLPEKFKSMPFQAIELRLMGVVPPDSELQWDPSSTATVKKWIQFYQTDNVEISAKVKFTLMDVIWITSLEFLEQLPAISSVAHVREIKNMLIEKQFGVASRQVYEDLEQMGIESGVLPRDFEVEDTSDDLAADDKDLELQQKPCTAGISPPCEQWAILTDNSLKISIVYWLSPHKFFVQMTSTVDRLYTCFDEIDDYMSSGEAENVKEPLVGTFCLAPFDKTYNRGIIKKILCGCAPSAEVFFCDIGKTVEVELDHLFQMPHDIKTMLPFQAICCKMVGIQPVANAMWTEKVCFEIYDDILEKCKSLKVKVFDKPKFDDANLLKYATYDAVLIDENMENINKKIVSEGLADYAPETKHYLSFGGSCRNSSSQSLDSDDTEDSKWGPCNQLSSMLQDCDIEFTPEELRDLLQLPPTALILQSESVPDDKIKSVTEENGVNFTELQNDTSSICVANHHTRNVAETVRFPISLIKQYRQPRVFWQQTDCLITLEIDAIYIEDYFLEASTTCLMFTSDYENEIGSFIINLFGGIDSKMVLHEIRGTKIIVRLMKLLKGFFWPRLCCKADKHLWLKYNLESKTVGVNENDLEEHCETNIQRNALYVDHDSNSSDDESDYNNIDDLANENVLFQPPAEDTFTCITR